MRFLILVNKEVPAAIGTYVQRHLDAAGHTVVKWTSGIQPGRDYDGVICFPKNDYNIDNVMNSFRKENDDFEYIYIGRGIYEGLHNDSIPNSNKVVVLYKSADDNNDMLFSNDPDDFDIVYQLFQDEGPEMEYTNGNDYNKWADLRLNTDQMDDTNVFNTVFRSVARDESSRTAWDPTGSGNTLTATDKPVKNAAHGWNLLLLKRK